MMSADLDYRERWPSDDWWMPLPDEEVADLDSAEQCRETSASGSVTPWLPLPDDDQEASDDGQEVERDPAK